MHSGEARPECAGFRVLGWGLWQICHRMACSNVLTALAAGAGVQVLGSFTQLNGTANFTACISEGLKCLGNPCSNLALMH